MKFLSIIIFLTLPFSCFTQSQEKTELIKQFAEGEDLLSDWEYEWESNIDHKRKEYPTLGNEFWDGLSTETVSNELESLKSEINLVFDKHFSLDQIKGIVDFDDSGSVDFYETEAGKHFATVRPLISRDLMVAVKKWGDEIIVAHFEEDQLSNLEQFEKPTTGCNSLKEGKFEYHTSDGGVVQVLRTIDFQIETYNGNEQKFKIEWIGDCKYSLTPENENDSKNIDVSIFEVNTGSHKQIANIKRLGIYDQNDLIKVE